MARLMDSFQVRTMGDHRNGWPRYRLEHSRLFSHHRLALTDVHLEALDRLCAFRRPSAVSKSIALSSAS